MAGHTAPRRSLVHLTLGQRVGAASAGPRCVRNALLMRRTPAAVVKAAVRQRRVCSRMAHPPTHTHTHTWLQVAAVVSEERAARSGLLLLGRACCERVVPRAELLLLLGRCDRHQLSPFTPSPPAHLRGVSSLLLLPIVQPVRQERALVLPSCSASQERKQCVSVRRAWCSPRAAALHVLLPV